MRQKKCVIAWIWIIGSMLAFHLFLPHAALADTPVEAGQDAGSAKATAPDAIAGDQAKLIDTDQVEVYWSKLMKEYGGYFPENQPPTFMEMMLPGGSGLSLKTILKGLLRFFFHEILVNGKLLATIVILMVFSMILETLQSAFEKKAVSKVAYTVTFMVMIVIAINSFSVAIGYAKGAVTGMIDFMLAMIPLMLTLLASMGNVVSVSVMHPLIIFMIHTVGTLIYTIVFPLLFFSTVLHIVSSLTDKYKITQLANLLRTISLGTLGGLLTIFLGVISVKGVSGSIADGVTIRTAKYVTGNFVPVVGRMFADATDTVVSASLLVKNSIGLAGVVIILFLCAFPALKIMALAFIYNLTAAIMQPLGDNPIIDCLKTIGKNMLYVFAAMAAVSFMFFLAITIIIAAGNVSVMVR